MTVMVTTCRHDPRPHCPCGTVAAKLCSFELSGRLAGSVCGRPLCEDCATPSRAGGAPGVCGPHARLMAREEAKS